MITLGLISTAGCGSTEEEVTAAVEEIFEEYGANLLAGDTNRWIALQTDDQVMMAPDAPAIFGKSDLLAVINGQLEVFSISEFDIEIEEVQVAGDWTYARGTFTALLDMKESGDQVPLDGKFLTIFEKQPDGTWLIHRDIFNSNVP